MEVTVFSGEYGDSDALKKEHALGLFVSTGEHRILFDFGNKTALKNLRALDLSAAEADLAVLSHGHSGAGGGLKGARARASRHQDLFPRVGVRRALFQKIPFELQDRFSAEEIAERGLFVRKKFSQNR